MNNNEYIFKVFDKMAHGDAFDFKLDTARLESIVRDDRNYDEIKAIAQYFLEAIEEARVLVSIPPHIIIRDPVVPWKCGCGKPGCRHCGNAEGSGK